MKLKRERGFPRFLTDTVLSINKGRDAAREHHAMKVRITSISSLDVLNTRARKQKKTSTIMKLQHCDGLCDSDYYVTLAARVSCNPDELASYLLDISI